MDIQIFDAFHQFFTHVFRTKIFVRSIHNATLGRSRENCLNMCTVCANYKEKINEH